MIYFNLILIFLASAQIEAKANLAKEFVNKKFTVGDQFEILVEIKTPAQIQPSEPFIDSLEPFVIIDQKHRSIQEKGVLKNIYLLRAASFSPGDLKFPAVKFLIRDSVKVDTIKTNEVAMTVNSVLPEKMEDINDIKGAVEFPNPLPLVIVLGLAGLGILYLIGTKLYKKYKKLKMETKPSLPCWDEAMNAITNVLNQDLIAKGLFKKFYYTLSEILKRYLEYRFGFPAIEQTTTEIILHMKREKIPLRDEFTDFFHRVDRVKYTKYVPPQSEIEAIVGQAKELITKTIPKDDTQEQK
ncbi:MAG: hypothetical protein ACUVTF_05080 [bacterium]